MEKDYSGFIKDFPKPEDERPAWLRLITSLRLSFFLDSTKKGQGKKDHKGGMGLQMKGGIEF